MTVAAELALDLDISAVAARHLVGTGTTAWSRRSRAGALLLASEHGFHTARDAAALLGVTSQGVAKWCRAGRLPAMLTAHEWWIEPDDLRAFALAYGYPDPLGVSQPITRFRWPYFITPHALRRVQQRIADRPAREVIAAVQAALQPLGRPESGWARVSLWGQMAYARVAWPEPRPPGDWPAVVTVYDEALFAGRRDRDLCHGRDGARWAYREAS